jgi:hypothetical protein
LAGWLVAMRTSALAQGEPNEERGRRHQRDVRKGMAMAMCGEWTFQSLFGIGTSRLGPSIPLMSALFCCYLDTWLFDDIVAFLCFSIPRNMPNSIIFQFILYLFYV